MTTDKKAEMLLTKHQRHKGGCLCGWSELGKSLPAHQAAKLREAGLLAADFNDKKEKNYPEGGGE